MALEKGHGLLQENEYLEEWRMKNKTCDSTQVCNRSNKEVW